MPPRSPFTDFLRWGLCLWQTWTSCLPTEKKKKMFPFDSWKRSRNLPSKVEGREFTKWGRRQSEVGGREMLVTKYLSRANWIHSSKHLRMSGNFWRAANCPALAEHWMPWGRWHREVARKHFPQAFLCYSKVLAPLLKAMQEH